MNKAEQQNCLFSPRLSSSNNYSITNRHNRGTHVLIFSHNVNTTQTKSVIAVPHLPFPSGVSTNHYPMDKHTLNTRKWNTETLHFKSPRDGDHWPHEINDFDLMTTIHKKCRSEDEKNRFPYVANIPISYINHEQQGRKKEDHQASKLKRYASLVAGRPCRCSRKCLPRFWRSRALPAWL
jgi:hypothetical protein